MLTFLGYPLLLLMGTVLGFLGAGGALLTLPILIYCFDMPISQAATHSLLIVGTTALLGVLLQYRFIVFEKAWLIAIPSLLTVSLSRHFLLPNLPDEILFGTKDQFLTGLFVILMLVAAYFMIMQPTLRHKAEKMTGAHFSLIVILSACLGIFMGLLGVGGGFLIVPVLVLFLHMDMREAVSTSIFIITLNSLIGLLVDEQLRVVLQDRALIAYTGLPLLGMWIGMRLAPRFSKDWLRRGFGWFVLTAAVCIGLVTFL